MNLGIAVLKMCSRCGQHGYILYSDGYRSEDFDCRYQARKVIDQALVDKKIDEHEKRLLLKQVEEEIPNEEDFETMEALLLALTQGDDIDNTTSHDLSDNDYEM